jgi:hypothetical protein
MKRKLEMSDSIVVNSVKRTLPKATVVVPEQHPLVGVLGQYGLLETIVTKLTSDDLLALALSSKATYQAIFPRRDSFENMLGLLSCSGKGVEIRQRCHQKSSFFIENNCTEFAQCASGSSRRSVESHPCVSCKINTCDECRTHCVYQSCYEASSDPEDPAELPNFSGFVLLGSFEQPILSPHHLSTGDATEVRRWEDPSITGEGPYHDQGYLDVALQLDSASAPECVSDVLDVDLGHHSLAVLSADSRYWGSPSLVLLEFSRVAEARKIFFCDGCFNLHAPKGPGALRPPMKPIPWLTNRPSSSPIAPCHCTLRNRFLDRWLCLRCYETEDSMINSCTALMPKQWTGLCRCNLSARHVLCIWCWGKVTEVDNEGEENTDNEEHIADYEEDDTEEEDEYTEEEDNTDGIVSST